MEVSARTDGRSFPVGPSARHAYLRIWPLDLGTMLVWPPTRELTEEEWEQRTRALVDFDNVRP
jgi:hypothetical protein